MYAQYTHIYAQTYQKTERIRVPTVPVRATDQVTWKTNKINKLNNTKNATTTTTTTGTFVAVFGDCCGHAECEQMRTFTHAQTYQKTEQTRVPTVPVRATDQVT